VAEIRHFWATNAPDCACMKKLFMDIWQSEGGRSKAELIHLPVSFKDDLLMECANDHFEGDLSDYGVRCLWHKHDDTVPRTFRYSEPQQA